MAMEQEEKAEGTADEAIGRPGPWGEGRYEKAGQPLDQSVLTPPRTSPREEKPVSTPVTRDDYRTPSSSNSGDEADSPGDDEVNAPGGDGG